MTDIAADLTGIAADRTGIAADRTGIAADLRREVTAGVTRPRAFREQQLDALVRMLLQHVSRWERALAHDLGKSAAESHLTEIDVLVQEARHARRRVGLWTRPKLVSPGIGLQPAAARIVPEPLGACLIIAPWNYPLQLMLSPLIGAIAAGNAAVLKPSELAPATSALLAELVPAYLDERVVRVVEGDADATTALLAERWDLVFFTGGAAVGRIVARAAAEHLTPTVLELGGKSPVYVDRSANLEVTARRLAWAKWVNAGQTCVAPDYVLAHREVADDFVTALALATREQLGDPRRSDDYGRIVNERHAGRLAELLRDGKPVIGGDADVDERFIAPTILTDVDPESPVMQEEIFGPVLPVLPVDGVDEFVRFVTEREKPLALYVFAEDRAVVRAVEQRTSSGGLGVNVAVAHLGAPGLPFGGVGGSGYGRYHGKHSFETFSHAKAVLDKPTVFDTMRLIYPPVSPERLRLITRLLTGR